MPLYIHLTSYVGVLHALAVIEGLGTRLKLTLGPHCLESVLSQWSLI